jgi:excisionase family DNA binding protein
MTRLVSVQDALHTLGISRATFYREVNEGRIPVVKVGRRSLVRQSDLDAWVAALPTYKRTSDAA